MTKGAKSVIGIRIKTDTINKVEELRKKFPELNLSTISALYEYLIEKGIEKLEEERGRGF